MEKSISFKDTTRFDSVVTPGVIALAKKDETLVVSLSIVNEALPRDFATTTLISEAQVNGSKGSTLEDLNLPSFVGPDRDTSRLMYVSHHKHTIVPHATESHVAAALRALYDGQQDSMMQSTGQKMSGFIERTGRKRSRPVDAQGRLTETLFYLCVKYDGKFAQIAKDAKSARVTTCDSSLFFGVGGGVGNEKAFWLRLDCVSWGDVAHILFPPWFSKSTTAEFFIFQSDGACPEGILDCRLAKTRELSWGAHKKRMDTEEESERRFVRAHGYKSVKAMHPLHQMLCKKSARSEGAAAAAFFTTSHEDYIMGKPVAIRYFL